MEANTHKICFASEFLKTDEVKQMDENQKLFVFGTLMEAGSDTSRVSINQIIAGAVTSPDWVLRAREHLDRVCGANAERLPGWSDKSDLPYINAVVKEGFRWRPNIAEIGAPTALIKDDEYEGYKFPAGTVFTWNAWAIALNPEEYPEPERFWPERFLDEHVDNALKGHWAFGPGKQVLTSSLSLVVSRLAKLTYSRASSMRWMACRRDECLDRHRTPFVLLRL
jgi:cytochrome P450